MGETDKYPSQDELDELRENMERVGTEPDRIEKVMKLAAVDREFYDDMRYMYQKEPSPLEDHPFENRPSLDGEFLIGTDLEGRPIGLTRRQVNEHMLIVGRSGVGKTTFFYNLMKVFQEKDISFMVFDFKNDYRHVADEFDLTVINWRDLKFNPLQPPPGVRVERWGEVLAETYAHATDLLIGSQSYFLERLQHVYWLYEDELEIEVYPSLFELRDVVRNHEVPRSSPRFNYKERVLGRLNMMTGFSGDIFRCSRGYPLEELLDRNVVFELQEPNQYVTNFVVETLLTWLFYYRDAHAHRQGLRHVVLFDEAKRVFSADREKQPEAGYPPVTELLGRVREFGEALVVADHEPSKLSDSVKANTNVKLWMSLGSGHDIEEMETTFGVEDEQVEFTRNLERGQAVIGTAEASPAPVQLPPYHVEKTTSEDEVRERMEAVLSALPYRDRVRTREFKEAIGEPSDVDEADLGEIAEALLVSVNEDSLQGMADRYDAINVGSRQGTEAKTELIDLGLLKEVVVQTGTPGRNPKLLELTEEGRRALERRGHEVKKTGRAGVEHRWWQQKIKAYYEDRGFDASVEYQVGGGERIDVYAERDGESVAVEVARSPEHEVANIRKCLDAGMDRVQVAYLEDSVKDQIEAGVKRAFGEIPEAVEFTPISAFA